MHFLSEQDITILLVFDYDYYGLLECADTNMFQHHQKECSCLHHILPPIKEDNFNLNSQGYNFVLW
jgi:hypothetical protein